MTDNVKFTPTPERPVHEHGDEWPGTRREFQKSHGREPVVWGFTFDSTEQEALFRALYEGFAGEEPSDEVSDDELRALVSRPAYADPGSIPSDDLRALVERVRAHLIKPEGPIGREGTGPVVVHSWAPRIVAGAATEAPAWQHGQTEINRAWFDALDPETDKGVAWLGQTDRKVALFEMDQPDSYGLLLLGSSVPGSPKDKNNELVLLPFGIDVATDRSLEHIAQSVQDVLSDRTNRLNLRTKELRQIVDYLKFPLSNYILTKEGRSLPDKNLRINQFQVDLLHEKDGQPLYRWYFSGAEPESYTRRWIEELPDNDPQVIYVVDKITGEKTKVVWMESTNNPQKFCLFYLVGDWVNIIPLDKREYSQFWSDLQDAMKDPNSVKKVPGFDDPKPEPYPLGVGIYVGRKLPSPKKDFTVQLVDRKLVVTYLDDGGGPAEKVEFAPPGSPAPQPADESRPAAPATTNPPFTVPWFNELVKAGVEMHESGDKKFLLLLREDNEMFFFFTVLKNGKLGVSMVGSEKDLRVFGEIIAAAQRGEGDKVTVRGNPFRGTEKDGGYNYALSRMPRMAGVSRTKEFIKTFFPIGDDGVVQVGAERLKFFTADDGALRGRWITNDNWEFGINFPDYQAAAATYAAQQGKPAWHHGHDEMSVEWFKSLTKDDPGVILTKDRGSVAVFEMENGSLGIVSYIALIDTKGKSQQPTYELAFRALTSESHASLIRDVRGALKRRDRKINRKVNDLIPLTDIIHLTENGVPLTSGTYVINGFVIEKRQSPDDPTPSEVWHLAGTDLATAEPVEEAEEAILSPDWLNELKPSTPGLFLVGDKRYFYFEIDEDHIILATVIPSETRNPVGATGSFAGAQDDTNAGRIGVTLLGPKDKKWIAKIRNNNSLLAPSTLGERAGVRGSATGIRLNVFAIDNNPNRARSWVFHPIEGNQVQVGKKKVNVVEEDGAIKLRLQSDELALRFPGVATPPSTHAHAHAAPGAAAQPTYPIFSDDWFTTLPDSDPAVFHIQDGEKRRKAVCLAGFNQDGIRQKPEKYYPIIVEDNEGKPVFAPISKKEHPDFFDAIFGTFPPKPGTEITLPDFLLSSFETIPLSELRKPGGFTRDLEVKEVDPPVTVHAILEVTEDGTILHTIEAIPDMGIEAEKTSYVPYSPTPEEFVERLYRDTKFSHGAAFLFAASKVKTRDRREDEEKTSHPKGILLKGVQEENYALLYESSDGVKIAAIFKKSPNAQSTLRTIKEALERPGKLIEDPSWIQELLKTDLVISPKKASRAEGVDVKALDGIYNVKLTTEKGQIVVSISRKDKGGELKYRFFLADDPLSTAPAAEMFSEEWFRAQKVGDPGVIENLGNKYAVFEKPDGEMILLSKDNKGQFYVGFVNTPELSSADITPQAFKEALFGQSSDYSVHIITIGPGHPNYSAVAKSFQTTDETPKPHAMYIKVVSRNTSADTADLPLIIIPFFPFDPNTPLEISEIKTEAKGDDIVISVMDDGEIKGTVTYSLSDSIASAPEANPDFSKEWLEDLPDDTSTVFYAVDEQGRERKFVIVTFNEEEKFSAIVGEDENGEVSLWNIHLKDNDVFLNLLQKTLSKDGKRVVPNSQLFFRDLPKQTPVMQVPNDETSTTKGSYEPPYNMDYELRWVGDRLFIRETIEGWPQTRLLAYDVPASNPINDIEISEPKTFSEDWFALQEVGDPGIIMIGEQKYAILESEDTNGLIFITSHSDGKLYTGGIFGKTLEINADAQILLRILRETLDGNGVLSIADFKEEMEGEILVRSFTIPSAGEGKTTFKLHPFNIPSTPIPDGNIRVEKDKFIVTSASASVEEATFTLSKTRASVESPQPQPTTSGASDLERLWRAARKGATSAADLTGAGAPAQPAAAPPAGPPPASLPAGVEEGSIEAVWYKRYNDLPDKHPAVFYLKPSQGGNSIKALYLPEINVDSVGWASFVALKGDKLIIYSLAGSNDRHQELHGEIKEVLGAGPDRQVDLGKYSGVNFSQQPLKHGHRYRSTGGNEIEIRLTSREIQTVTVDPDSAIGLTYTLPQAPTFSEMWFNHDLPDDHPALFFAVDEKRTIEQRILYLEDEVRHHPDLMPYISYSRQGELKLGLMWTKTVEENRNLAEIILKQIGTAGRKEIDGPSLGKVQTFLSIALKEGAEVPWQGVGTATLSLSRVPGKIHLLVTSDVAEIESFELLLSVPTELPLAQAQPAAVPPAPSQPHPIFSDEWFETLPPSDPHVFEYVGQKGGVIKTVYLTDPSRPDDYAIITMRDDGNLIFAPMNKDMFNLEEILKAGERRVIDDPSVAEAFNITILYSMKQILSSSGYEEKRDRVVTRMYKEGDSIVLDTTLDGKPHSSAKFSLATVPFAAAQPAAARPDAAPPPASAPSGAKTTLPKGVEEGSVEAVWYRRFNNLPDEHPAVFYIRYSQSGRRLKGVLFDSPADGDLKSKLVMTESKGGDHGFLVLRESHPDEKNFLDGIRAATKSSPKKDIVFSTTDIPASVVLPLKNHASYSYGDYKVSLSLSKDTLHLRHSLPGGQDVSVPYRTHPAPTFSEMWFDHDLPDDHPTVFYAVDEKGEERKFLLTSVEGSTNEFGLVGFDEQGEFTLWGLIMRPVNDLLLGIIQKALGGENRVIRSGGFWSALKEVGFKMEIPSQIGEKTERVWTQSVSFLKREEGKLVFTDVPRSGAKSTSSSYIVPKSNPFEANSIPQPDMFSEDWFALQEVGDNGVLEIGDETFVVLTSEPYIGIALVGRDSATGRLGFGMIQKSDSEGAPQVIENFKNAFSGKAELSRVNLSSDSSGFTRTFRTLAPSSQTPYTQRVEFGFLTGGEKTWQRYVKGNTIEIPPGGVSTEKTTFSIAPWKMSEPKPAPAPAPEAKAEVQPSPAASATLLALFGATGEDSDIVDEEKVAGEKAGAAIRAFERVKRPEIKTEWDLNVEPKQKRDITVATDPLTVKMTIDSSAENYRAFRKQRSEAARNDKIIIRWGANGDPVIYQVSGSRGTFTLTPVEANPDPLEGQPADVPKGDLKLNFRDPKTTLTFVDPKTSEIHQWIEGAVNGPSLSVIASTAKQSPGGTREIATSPTAPRDDETTIIAIHAEGDHKGELLAKVWGIWKDYPGVISDSSTARQFDSTTGQWTLQISYPQTIAEAEEVVRLIAETKTAYKESIKQTRTPSWISQARIAAKAEAEKAEKIATEEAKRAAFRKMEETLGPMVDAARGDIPVPEPDAVQGERVTGRGGEGEKKPSGPRTEKDTLADPTGGDVVMVGISKEIDADDKITSITINELIIHGETIPSDSITVTDEDAVGAVRELPLPAVTEFPFTLTVQRDVPEGVEEFEITIKPKEAVTSHESRVTSGDVKLNVSKPTTTKFADIGEEVSVTTTIQTGERSAIGDLFTLKVKKGEHPRTKETIITQASLTLNPVAIEVLGFDPESKSSVISPDLPIVLGKDPIKITLNYPEIGEIEYTLAVKERGKLMAVRGPIKNEKGDWKIEFRGEDEKPFLMGHAHDTAVIEFPLEKTAAVRGARRVLRETYFSVARSHTGSLWLWSILAGKPIDLNLGKHDAIRIEARRIRGADGGLTYHVDRDSFHPYKRNPEGDDPVHAIQLSPAEYDLIRKHLEGLPAEGAVPDKPLELPDRPIPVDLPSVLPSEEISIAPREVLLPTRETMEWLHKTFQGRSEKNPISFGHMDQIDQRLEFETENGMILSIPVRWSATRRVNNPFSIDRGYFETDDAGKEILENEKPKLKGTGRRIEVYQKGHPETRRMVDTDVHAIDMGGFWNIYVLADKEESIKAFNLKIVKARLEIDKGEDGRLVYESPVLFALVNTMDEDGSEENVQAIRENARAVLSERAHKYYDEGKLEEITSIYLGKRRFSQAEGQQIELTYISETTEGTEVARLEGTRFIRSKREFRPESLLILHKGKETIQLRHTASRKQADIIRLTEVLNDGRSGRRFDWNVRRHVILERKTRSPKRIDDREFLLVLQRKGIPLKTKILVPRGEAGERTVEYKEGATVQINAEVPEMPEEHQGFALPTNIEPLVDPKQIRDLVAQTALHDEFFIPVERTVFEQSLIGGPEEVMTFIGRRSRIMIEIYMKYDEGANRYFAHYEKDPTFPIRYARVLIPDPARRKENVYFDVRSGFHEKRMPGPHKDRVDLQIYGTKPIDLILHRLRYDKTFSGKETFGFRAEVKGQEPGTDDSNFVATMRTWLRLLGMHDDQTPDMLSRAVGEMKIGEPYDVKLGDRYELGLEVTRSADKAYVVDGIEITSDSRLDQPVARILYVDTEDTANDSDEKFFLVYRDGGLYYLYDPEKDQYYNFILSSDGQLWVWKRRRNIRDFLEPPESVGYPMVRILGGEYEAAKKRRVAGRKEIESRAVREIYEDVEEGWRAFELTTVLGRQQQVAKEAVRFGKGDDGLIRVRFIVKIDPDGKLHFEPGKPRDEDKDLEKTFLFGEDFKIDHSEDIWTDTLTGKTHRGHLRVVFHREKVVVERTRKKKGGQSGETEAYDSPLSPYGVLEFDTRDNLIGNWEDFGITKAHAHETRGFTRRKVMPGGHHPERSEGSPGEEVGFLTRRAGVLVDETTFTEEMFVGADAIEDGAKVLADLEKTMARPKDVPMLLGALVLLGKARTGRGVIHHAQTIEYDEQDLVNLAAFAALRNPAIKGKREADIIYGWKGDGKKPPSGTPEGGAPAPSGSPKGEVVSAPVIQSSSLPRRSPDGRSVGTEAGHRVVRSRDHRVTRREPGPSLIHVLMKLVQANRIDLRDRLREIESELTANERVELFRAKNGIALVAAAERILAEVSSKSPSHQVPKSPSHVVGRPGTVSPTGTVVPVR